MVSPLETWLRDTAEVVAPQTHLAGESTLTVSNSAAPSRDSAEGLLGLDIWNGVPDGSRLLSASATFQPTATEPAGIIQGWADHIFQPLV
jgi:hypothetical protein